MDRAVSEERGPCDGLPRQAPARGREGSRATRGGCRLAAPDALNVLAGVAGLSRQVCGTNAAGLDELFEKRVSVHALKVAQRVR